jgi:hypothetical protein
MESLIAKIRKVVREREEVLTAPRALLLRRAELIRVRAEHAAVTLPRPEHGPAARTCVEVLTGVLGIASRLAVPHSGHVIVASVTGIGQN